MNQTFLYSKNRSLDISKPQIMAIINLTADSFSDAGLDKSSAAIIDRVAQALKDGATIIDLGAESSRPGAIPISLSQEEDLLLPVLEKLRNRFDCWISIDSYKTEIMQQAAQAGADILNDINGFKGVGAFEVAANYGLAIVIMHMQGVPQSMQLDLVNNEDPLGVVENFLSQQTQLALTKGIRKESIIIDPGFGFGKTLKDNYLILNQLQTLKDRVGFPILSGTSRKSMIGQLIDQPVELRDKGSLVTELMALQQGAQILRVHNVVQTAELLKIFNYAQNPQ